jgi:hypothetical protein
MENRKKEILETLKIHLTDKSAWDRFSNFLDQANNVDLDKFLQEIDDSDYSISDWVEAFLGFDTWLTNEGKSGRDFGMMLGYLHCCQLMICAKAGQPNLQSIVLQCLADHGFEFVNPSQV